MKKKKKASDAVSSKESRKEILHLDDVLERTFHAADDRLNIELLRSFRERRAHEKPLTAMQKSVLTNLAYKYGTLIESPEDVEARLEQEMLEKRKMSEREKPRRPASMAERFIGVVRRAKGRG